MKSFAPVVEHVQYTFLLVKRFYKAVMLTTRVSEHAEVEHLV